MGYRKIAIILSNLFSTERERMERYKAALAQHEIPIDPSIIITDGGPFKKKRYRELIQKLLKRQVLA